MACNVVELDYIGTGKEKSSSKRLGTDTRSEVEKIVTWANGKAREISLEDKLSSYFRECDLISTFSHPNIIAIDKIFVTNSNLYIFRDLLTMGDLHDYICINKNKL